MTCPLCREGVKDRLDTNCLPMSVRKVLTQKQQESIEEESSNNSFFVPFASGMVLDVQPLLEDLYLQVALHTPSVSTQANCAVFTSPLHITNTHNNNITYTMQQSLRRCIQTFLNSSSTDYVATFALIHGMSSHSYSILQIDSSTIRRLLSTSNITRLLADSTNFYRQSLLIGNISFQESNQMTWPYNFTIHLNRNLLEQYVTALFFENVHHIVNF